MDRRFGDDSFCELPRRSKLPEFGPANDAALPEQPVVRESQSNAVLRALLDMQEEVRRLELDKNALNGRFQDVREEAAQYRTALDRQQRQAESAACAVSKDQVELRAHLSQADERCQRLEKELDYMRQMVAKAESDRKNAEDLAVAFRVEAERHRSEDQHWSEPPTLRHQTVASVSSDSDDEEERRRNLEEERARTRAVVDHANRVLLNVQKETSRLPIFPSGSRQPKRRKPRQTRVQPQSIHHCDQKHYHLNLAHIPFVVGTSTTPSHSVAGSLQEVLAQLKQHHPIICDHVHSHRSRQPRSMHQSCYACKAQQHQPIPHQSTSRLSMDNAQLLRDMKTLRSTLQRDDVCWS